MPKRVRREPSVTTIHVTRSLMEAIHMAVIILHMRDNRTMEKVMRP
ncbi:MAG: hypothetical protein N2689_11880 [Verrucomicrobiae bacterium]|nr:hypothetical protein [Verrucomicrobiae bacterium]